MQKRPWYSRAIGAALVATTLTLAGCAESTSSESEGDPAATVEAIEGSQVSRVTLSELGSKRLGIATEAVSRSADGKSLVIPYTAIVWDNEGVAWVFTNPSGHSFVREQVEVSSIDGDRVLASSGPAEGTAVVTVGVAELVGAEAGLGA